MGGWAAASLSIEAKNSKWVAFLRGDGDICHPTVLPVELPPAHRSHDRSIARVLFSTVIWDIWDRAMGYPISQRKTLPMLELYLQNFRCPLDVGMMCEVWDTPNSVQYCEIR